MIAKVAGQWKCQWAAKGVKVRNPAFNGTPTELMCGLVTEKGVFFTLNSEKIKQLFE